MRWINSISKFLNTSLGGSVLGIGSSLLGGLFTSNQNRKMMREQNEFNAEQADINRQFQSKEAEIARDWQERFYQQYQSPQAMVHQYEQAGINPVLAAGHATNTPPAATSSSGSMAQGVSPGYQSVAGIMEQFGKLALLKAEIDLKQSQARKNLSSAEKDYSSIRVDVATIKQMSVENEQILNSISNDNKRVETEVRHINGILSQIAESNKVSKKQVEQIDAQIKRMSVQNALDEQQKITLCAQQVLLEFQAEESGMRQHEILSKTRLNNAQANAMSETMYEQRFKNKYLYLYGTYPPAEAAINSATKWTRKFKSNFQEY